MKAIRKNQTGFGLLPVLLVVVVLGAIAVVGLRMANNASAPLDNNGTVATKRVPPAIKNKADLQKAAQALDTTAIDTGVNPGELDSDLNSLL